MFFESLRTFGYIHGIWSEFLLGVVSIIELLDSLAVMDGISFSAKDANHDCEQFLVVFSELSNIC